MMKVNKIFTVLTAALLLAEILVFTGCKSKTMKVDPVSVGSDYSSGTCQTETFSIETGIKLEDEASSSTKINKADFYDPDGTLLKYVYLKTGEMVKLIAFNGEKATILAPVSEWTDSDKPVFKIIETEDFTTSFTEFIPETKEIYELENYVAGQWTGKNCFTAEDEGIYIFDNTAKGNENFTFHTGMYTLRGNYVIEKDKNNVNVKINLFDNPDNFYDDNSEYTKYAFQICSASENSFNLNDYESFYSFNLKRHWIFAPVEKYKALDFGPKNFFNRHNNIDMCKNFLSSQNSIERKPYIEQFVKFGIYIDDPEYKKIYDSYWNKTMKQNETSSFPFYNPEYDFTADTPEKFYKTYISKIKDKNPEQKNYKEAMNDFESISNFYDNNNELYIYGILNTEYKNNNYIPQKIYEKPDTNSKCVYKYPVPYAVQITALGPKDTINGVTSHWIEIVLPRYVWKTYEPEYGWVFGSNIEGHHIGYGSDDRPILGGSNSLNIHKNKPWDFEYDDIEIDNYKKDSIFYSISLYDANENLQTAYGRYLLFSQNKRLKNLNLNINSLPDPIEMEFIRAGVQAESLSDEREKLKDMLNLQNIYIHMIQNNHSLYPVYLKGADNLAASKQESSENPDKLITKYKADNKIYWMIYNSYRDSDYRIHDEIEVIENPESTDSKTVASWKSNQFDIISETKAYLSFDNGVKPVLHIQKLNGTFRTKEELN